MRRSKNTNPIGNLYFAVGMFSPAKDVIRRIQEAETIVIVVNELK